MTSVLFGFGFSLFTAIVVIYGDYLIKIAADGSAADIEHDVGQRGPLGQRNTKEGFTRHAD